MSIRPLSKVLQEKAEIELNEVPSRIHEDLQHIKDWLIKQPHLKARIDDRWLLSFLRGNKFSLERTKTSLDMYYSTKSLFPELYANRDPFLPEIQEVLKRSVMIVLPKTADPSKPTVLILRAKESDPEKVPLQLGIKVMLMMTEILLIENDNFTIAGQQVLLDMKGTPYQYLTQLTPTTLNKYLTHFHKAYTMRPQGLHVLNCPTLIYQTVYKIVENFLSEKLKSRIHVYTEKNSSTLYQKIPPSILPVEYGGNEVSVHELAAAWKLKVESYHDWFLEDDAYCADETLRLDKSNTAEFFFGEDGSFRKLAID